MAEQTSDNEDQPRPNGRSTEYVIENRAETIKLSSLNHATRKGESDRMVLGKNTMRDVVHGRERTRVDGMLTEEFSDLNVEGATMVHNYNGNLLIQGTSDSSIMAGVLMEKFGRLTYVCSVMSDNMIGGGGIKTTAGLGIDMHALMGLEEKIVSNGADGVYLELYAKCFEREYSNANHAIGAMVTAGSSYTTTATGFFPLMKMIKRGVRNQVPGGGGGGAPPADGGGAAAPAAAEGASLLPSPSRGGIQLNTASNLADISELENLEDITDARLAATAADDPGRVQILAQLSATLDEAGDALDSIEDGLSTIDNFQIDEALSTSRLEDADDWRGAIGVGGSADEASAANPNIGALETLEKRADELIDTQNAIYTQIDIDGPGSMNSDVQGRITQINEQFRAVNAAQDAIENAEDPIALLNTHIAEIQNLETLDESEKLIRIEAIEDVKELLGDPQVPLSQPTIAPTTPEPPAVTLTSDPTKLGDPTVQYTGTSFSAERYDVDRLEHAIEQYKSNLVYMKQDIVSNNPIQLSDDLQLQIAAINEHLQVANSVKDSLARNIDPRLILGLNADHLDTLEYLDETTLALKMEALEDVDNILTRPEFISHQPPDVDINKLSQALDNEAANVRIAQEASGNIDDLAFQAYAKQKQNYLDLSQRILGNGDDPGTMFDTIIDQIKIIDTGGDDVLELQRAGQLQAAEEVRDLLTDPDYAFVPTVETDPTTLTFNRASGSPDHYTFEDLQQGDLMQRLDAQIEQQYYERREALQLFDGQNNQNPLQTYFDYKQRALYQAKVTLANGDDPLNVLDALIQGLPPQWLEVDDIAKETQLSLQYKALDEVRDLVTSPEFQAPAPITAPDASAITGLDNLEPEGIASVTGGVNPVAGFTEDAFIPPQIDVVADLADSSDITPAITNLNLDAEITNLEAITDLQDVGEIEISTVLDDTLTETLGTTDEIGGQLDIGAEQLDITDLQTSPDAFDGLDGAAETGRANIEGDFIEDIRPEKDFSRAPEPPSEAPAPAPAPGSSSQDQFDSLLRENSANAAAASFDSFKVDDLQEALDARLSELDTLEAVATASDEADAALSAIAAEKEAIFKAKSALEDGINPVSALLDAQALTALDSTDELEQAIQAQALQDIVDRIANPEFRTTAPPTTNAASEGLFGLDSEEFRQLMKNRAEESYEAADEVVHTAPLDIYDEHYTDFNARYRQRVQARVDSSAKFPQQIMDSFQWGQEAIETVDVLEDTATPLANIGTSADDGATSVINTLDETENFGLTGVRGDFENPERANPVDFAFDQHYDNLAAEELKYRRASDWQSNLILHDARLDINKAAQEFLATASQGPGVNGAWTPAQYDEFLDGIQGLSGVQARARLVQQAETAKLAGDYDRYVLLINAINNLDIHTNAIIDTALESAEAVAGNAFKPLASNVDAVRLQGAIQDEIQKTTDALFLRMDTAGEFDDPTAITALSQKMTALDGAKKAVGDGLDPLAFLDGDISALTLSKGTLDTAEELTNADAGLRAYEEARSIVQTLVDSPDYTAAAPITGNIDEAVIGLEVVDEATNLADTARLEDTDLSPALYQDPTETSSQFHEVIEPLELEDLDVSVPQEAKPKKKVGFADETTILKYDDDLSTKFGIKRGERSVDVVQFDDFENLNEIQKADWLQANRASRKEPLPVKVLDDLFNPAVTGSADAADRLWIALDDPFDIFITQTVALPLDDVDDLVVTPEYLKGITLAYEERKTSTIHISIINRLEAAGNAADLSWFDRIRFNDVLKRIKLYRNTGKSHSPGLLGFLATAPSQKVFTRVLGSQGYKQGIFAPYLVGVGSLWNPLLPVYGFGPDEIARQLALPLDSGGLLSSPMY